MKKMIFFFSLITAMYMPYTPLNAMLDTNKVVRMLEKMFVKEAETTIKKEIEKEIEQSPLLFLTKLALSGLVPSIITSIMTKTKLEKLWHIPVGLASWLLMHDIQTNYKANKLRDKNTVYTKSAVSSTNFAFMVFYGTGVVTVEGARGIKALARHVFRFYT